MKLWKIAWRSIQQRSLASLLTAISMALGVALVVAVLVIHGVVDKSFRRSAQGYDLIVGPKGSRLELVLNTVYHLGKPIGSVPFSYYTDLADARFASYVERAVPICMGDGYKGFRVIGTLPDMFKLEYLDGEKYQFQEGASFSWDGWSEAVVGATAARKAGLQVGKTFRSMHGEDEDSESEHEQQIDFKVVGVLKPTGTPTDRAIFVNLAGFFRLHGFAEYYYEDHNGQNCAQFPIGSALPEMFEKAAAPGGEKYKFTAGGNLHQDAPFEAVIGANVAQKTRLKPGDTIYPTSVATGPLQNHVIKIVGVLAPTKSPHDDGIFMHEAGLAQIRGAGDPPAHKAAEGEQPAPHLDKEPKISAILIASNNEDITRAAEFPSKISEELDAQAVAPVKEIAALLEGIVGNIQLVLLILAVLIVVVAGIGILVSIYNSMNDRRHEIAVMRALGARRSTVMAIILLESILLALGGGAIGLVLGHSLTAILAPVIAANTHVSVNALQFQGSELILIPGLIALASLVGYLPAVIAYRTDVAQSLISSP
ncbi:MAG: ABC transporter permease [Thermoguttaceae bacterium]